MRMLWPTWRAVLMALVALSFTGSSAPANSDGNTVLVTGAVWIDENLDGVRQEDELRLQDFDVAVGKEGRFFGGTRTDPAGQFRLTLPAGQLYHFDATYTDPSLPLLGSPLLGTHGGCADIYLFPEDDERNIFIRLRPLRSRPIEVPAEPPDWPVADGHFFKQVAGRNASCDVGFAVLNADGVQFWDAFQAFGVERLGYPASNRFAWNGEVLQVFEQAALRWNPELGEADLIEGRSPNMFPDVPPEFFFPQPAPSVIGLDLTPP